MRFTLLKVEINGYKKQIDIAVIDLNDTDMFLKYNWLVKHSPEVDWKIETIWFTRCSRNCRIQHQDISFRNQGIQLIDN